MSSSANPTPAVQHREPTTHVSKRPLEVVPGKYDAKLSKSEIRTKRSSVLSDALAVHYKDPLMIVKGEYQYLIDENGKKYLDCCNNVCHVGHCHPDVVTAASTQLAQLNTNTRYLHPNIVLLAEKLIATMPDKSLDTVFFVNSGSEANDLAFRLANKFTGNMDMLVLDGAYHGHTYAVTQLSPYKFKQAGGFPKADHVHLLPCPDMLQHETWDETVATHYATRGKEVIDAIPSTRADRSSRGLAGVLIESIPSCPGIVEFPPGYLQQLFSHVRSAGGLCIVDEVQVGFGRVGAPYYWAFERQAGDAAKGEKCVVPDIVTIGKPMGNGYPVAAVITRRDIASKFASLEYFNTYGGTPASCAVALEVMDVIEREKLRENAAEIGSYLTSALDTLRQRYRYFGPTRGRGLMLGVQLVHPNDQTCVHAELGPWLREQLKDLHFLIGVEGFGNDVLKFKPPMCFDRQNADDFIAALDSLLARWDADHEQDSWAGVLRSRRPSRSSSAHSANTSDSDDERDDSEKKTKKRRTADQ